MKPKKRNERAKDVKELYKRIKTMPPTKRVQSVLNKEGQYWMSLLTPTQFAELFPDYYKKALPDVGLTMATSGAVIKGGQTPLLGGGGGASTSKVQGAPGTASPVSSGGGSGGGKRFNPRGAPSAEPSPPDPLKVLKKGIEDKTGIKIAPPTPAEGPIPVDAKGNVDKTAFYNQAVRTFADSPLNGFIPKDGEKYGIDGTPESWADFAMRTAKVESGFNVNTTNPADPGGSFGLFQWGNHYGINGDNWKDPQAQLDAFKEYSKQWVVEGGGYIQPPAGVEAKRYQGHGGFAAAFSTVRNDKVNSTEAWSESESISGRAKEEAAKEVEKERDKSGSVDPNDFPRRPIDKPEGMNDQLTKLWETFKTPQEQARFVEALQKLGTEEKRGVDVANEMAKTAQKDSSGVPQMKIGDLPIPEVGETGRANRMSKGGQYPTPNLKKIDTPFGKISVDESSAVAFQGFFNDLGKAGAPLRQPGSYNHRPKRWGGGWSEHAHGNAVDFDDEVMFSKDFKKWMEENPGKYEEVKKKWGIVQPLPEKDPAHHEFGGKISQEAYDQVMELKKQQDEEAKKSAVPATEEEARKMYEKQDEKNAPEIIKRQQEKDVSDPSDLNAIPRRPGEQMIVPMDQRGITSGHPNEGQAGATEAPSGQAAPKSSEPAPTPPPTVTPAPAPTPPGMTSPNVDQKRDPNQNVLPPIDVPQNQSKATPQPSAVPPADVAHHIEPRSPSENRAYAQSKFEGRPGETGTTTYIPPSKLA